MNSRSRLFVAGAALTALLSSGCGGAAPGFGNMSQDLRPPGLSSPAASRRATPARSLWDVDRLRRAPLNTQVLADRTERAGDVSLTWREVTFDSEVMPGSSEKLFALFAFPARKPGDPADVRYPTVLLIHDLGEVASDEAVRAWATRGYAALALDLPGKGPGREKSRSTGPDMTEEALFKVTGGARESYLFRAVGAAMRGVNFLREQKEVDPRKVALYGESWGGVTAALTGSLDDRVRALVAVYAAGSLQRGTPAAAKLKELPPPERDTWAKSFDVLAYVSSDQPAALFAGGTNDKRWAAEGLLDTYRRYNGARALALAPGKEHELDAPARTTIHQWLDATLANAPLPVAALSVTAENGQWIAKTDTRRPARAVSFFYGAGKGEWSEREWKEIKATAGDRRWTAPIPAEAADAPLLARTYDASGAALTTEPVPTGTRSAEKTAPKAPAGGE